MRSSQPSIFRHRQAATSRIGLATTRWDSVAVEHRRLGHTDGGAQLPPHIPALYEGEPEMAKLGRIVEREIEACERRKRARLNADAQ